MPFFSLAFIFCLLSFLTLLYSSSTDNWEKCLIFVDIEIEATLVAPLGLPPPTAELEASVVTTAVLVAPDL